MSRVAKAGHVMDVLAFLVAAFYACLLLLSSMAGLQSAQNTLIYACGLLFIFRAVFAIRAGILRIRGSGDEPPARSWRASDTLFNLGDLISLASLALTAWILSTRDLRLNSPVVPFGVGLAAGFLFYLIAIPLRFANK